MFILLVIWLCNGEGARLVPVTPFSPEGNYYSAFTLKLVRYFNNIVDK